MSQEKEKIVVFRRVWRSGKRYWISIPKEVVEHYKLEGKLVKGILEVIESEHNSAK